jgi:hypothetical protein
MLGLFVTLPSPSHSFHNRLRHTALANLLRWIIPRPPNSVGLMECGQFALHFPLISFLDPAQRKLFKRLSISLSVDLGALSDVRQYTTCEVRTALTKVDLPAWLIFLSFQTVSLLTSLSTRGWKSTLRNLMFVRGSPRYFVEKSTCLARKSRRTSSRSTSWHLMGMTDDFRTFV